MAGFGLHGSYPDAMARGASCSQSGGAVPADRIRYDVSALSLRRGEVVAEMKNYLMDVCILDIAITAA